MSRSRLTNLISTHRTQVSVAGAAVLALTLVAAMLWSTSVTRASAQEIPVAADDIFDTGAQRVAISDDGSTIAYAWLMYDGSVMRLRTRYTTDGGRSWTSQHLSSKSADAESPALAVSDDGQTIMLGWRQVQRSAAGKTKSIILGTTSDGGQTWKKETVSNANTKATNVDTPAVATDANGQNLAISWNEQTGGDLEVSSVVKVRSSTDGGNSWQTEVLSAVDNYALDPGVLLSGDAQTIVYYWSVASDGNEYWVARYSVDGGSTWVSDQITPTNQFVYDLNAAISTSGRTIVFGWAEPDASGATMVKTRYTTNSAATWIDEDVSPAGRDADDPQVSVDDSGSTIAMVWSYFGQDGLDSRYTRNGGGTWTDFDPGGTGEEGQSPHVAVSGDGQTFSYSWASWQGDKAAYESRYSTDGGATWSAEKQMSKPVNSIGDSATAVSGAGERIAYTWTWDAGSAKSTVQARYSTNQGGNWTNVNLSGSSPVKKLKVKSSTVTRSAATVSWKKPASIDSNGVKKYQVRYKAGKQGDWKKWKSASPKKLKVKKGKYAKKLKKLKSGKTYRVQVRSKNSISPGGIHNPVIFQTR